MPFWLWASMGPSNNVLDGVQIPHGKGQFWGKGMPNVKYSDCLPWTVRKWPSQSRFHLGYELGRTQGSTLYDGGPDPHAKGQILGKWLAQACPVTLCRELFKNGWTDSGAIWVVESGGPKEACVTWDHIDATWRIRLNRPCAGGDAALCQITLPTCY